MYIFASPVGLWKVVVRVPVGCSYLFASIDCFSLSKPLFELFIQAFFCWFLTCLYHIYCIRFHLSWTLSSDVLENCLWALSKPYICICFPHRFVEGCGYSSNFLILPVDINKLISFKAVTQVGYWVLIYKHLIILLLSLVL